MKLRNINIVTQLLIGMFVMLLFVITLGIVSFQMNNKLQNQTEIIFNHPFKVTQAAGQLKVDILSISHEMKDRFLETDSHRISYDIKQIEELNAHAFTMIDFIYTNYLGPKADVDSIKIRLVRWNIERNRTIELMNLGYITEAESRNTDFGIEERLEKDIIASIQTVMDFANGTVNRLYQNSIVLTRNLNIQLIILTVAFLIFSILINFILLRSIRRPLAEINSAAKKFHKGDMNSRSTFQSKNEFGELSKTYNVLAEKIQANNELSEKANHLAKFMLSEDEAKPFFHALLLELAENSNSNMAAVYLLSEDKKEFVHFESIGIENNARNSFSATSFEGEFGRVLSTAKIQHLKEIPENTRFVFNTVMGVFTPREILTIPLVASSEVIAIISLASISTFSEKFINLLDSVLDMMSARVEGILAYRKIRNILTTLEVQNRELEAQKSELSTQSSELLQQNTELEIQKVQLSEASRLKTNFLSNMSHELRTPLNSVIALSGVLNRRLASRIPEEEHSYIEVIERNGKHLLELINDILDIARIEAGREEMETSNFNVNKLIYDVVGLIKPQANLKGIELLINSSADEINISSDPSKLKHILQNLIGNAVKFTEKGKVEIICTRVENSIDISIIDTGIGISDANIEHIFDEFRQADNSTSRRYGGSGLGLAIAKKYANLLGGNISVSSEEGKGSVFILNLPIQFTPDLKIIEKTNIASFNTVKTQSHQVSQTQASTKTVLLVEDSEPAIIQIKDFLEESGYKILVAHNGGEALAIIESVIPDAMILDLMMPEVDGFKVLQQLRNAEPTAHIPVLILTAKHISKEELNFLKRNNIHQLIQKGAVSRDELLNSLSNMMFPIKEEKKLGKHRVRKIEGKPNVLVVEDNPDNMITVKALLSESYTVIEAIDGYKAIELCAKYTPDLVLMDIALPGIDGIEAFKIIRKDVKLQHIPVIALTASAMDTERETILAHGFDAYISKPIEEKVFFKIVNYTLYGE